jgi:ankyrin repeat protein
MDSHVDAFFASIAEDDAAAVRAALSAEPALVGARDRYLGSTPLHQAAFRGAPEIVRMLLDLGAEVDALERESGTTPLHWAAEAGHLEIARLLLARGATLEVRDSWYGLTPLGWATAVFWAARNRRDRSATVQLLRSAGARADAFVELGASDVAALRRVVLADPAELSRRLGFAGDEMQPLHWAGAYGREEAIGVLLDLGADASARTSVGLTPLGAALRRAQAGSASAFLSAGFAGDESTAVVGGFVHALDGVDSGTLTPALSSRLLFVAAGEGHARMVEALVGRGADPATRLRLLVHQHPMMATPLHVAVEQGREAAANALLDAGAKPSAGAEDGAPTPLHVAAAEGLDALVRLLLDRGADPVARESRWDSTPADWAGSAGHRDLARRLLAAAS